MNPEEDGNTEERQDDPIPPPELDGWWYVVAAKEEGAVEYGGIFSTVKEAVEACGDAAEGMGIGPKEGNSLVFVVKKGGDVAQAAHSAVDIATSIATGEKMEAGDGLEVGWAQSTKGRVTIVVGPTVNHRSDREAAGKKIDPLTFRAPETGWWWCAARLSPAGGFMGEGIVRYGGAYETREEAWAGLKEEVDNKAVSWEASVLFIVKKGETVNDAADRALAMTLRQMGTPQAEGIRRAMGGGSQ